MSYKSYDLVATICDTRQVTVALASVFPLVNTLIRINV